MTVSAKPQITARLLNTTTSDATANATNNEGVIYLSSDRSFVNTLSVTLSVTSGGAASSITLPGNSPKPAFMLVFPDDVQVAGCSADKFTAQQQPSGAWWLVTSVNVTLSSLVITLTGATATQDDAGAVLTVGSLGAIVSQPKLSLLQHPITNDQPLTLTVEPTNGALYVSTGDLSAFVAAKQKDPNDQSVISFINSATDNQLALTIIGLTSAINAKSGEWHIRISFDSTDVEGGLLAPATASLASVQPGNMYGNAWDDSTPKQAAPAVFQYTAEGTVLLQGGSNNQVNLTFQGLFPNATEGYGNVYIAYQNLQGYQAGVFMLPVYKKSYPSIDAFTIADASTGTAVPATAPIGGDDGFGPVVVSSAAPISVSLDWAVSGLGPNPAPPVAITMTTGRSQQRFAAAAAVLHSAMPPAPASTNPDQGPNNASFSSLPATSDVAMLPPVTIWWDGNTYRTLTLVATDSFKRTAKKTIYLELQRPAPTLDFHVIPSSINWWTYTQPRVTWTVHEVDKVSINGAPQTTICPDLVNGVAIDTQPRNAEAPNTGSVFRFDVDLTQDTTTARTSFDIPAIYDPSGLTMTTNQAVQAIEDVVSDPPTSPPQRSETKTAYPAATVQETLTFAGDGSLAATMTLLSGSTVKWTGDMGRASQWPGIVGAWEIVGSQLSCNGIGDLALYEKASTLVLRCVNERTARLILYAYSGPNASDIIYVTWNPS